MKRSLLALNLVDAAARIVHGELDPVVLTEAYLERIVVTEPGINAYYTVDVEGARHAAAQARDELAAGTYRGPLHGIPVGVKDIIDTAGLRTTYGSTRYRHHVPSADAAVVARLREAGAVILGKHATHEFAWGGRTDNPHYGVTRNPRDRTRIPGGSSGGGAASVVDGSCLVAIGTDTAGSIRIPAALCGCVGYKPTRDWIGMEGIYPLAPSFDCVGVLARTPADAALAVDTLGGRRTNELAEVPKQARIGVLLDSESRLDGAVAAGVARAEAALESAGHIVNRITLADVSARAEALLTLLKLEAEAIHRPAFRTDPLSYGADIAVLLRASPDRSAVIAAARQTMERSIDALLEILADVDVVMGATVPIQAPPIGKMEVNVNGCGCPIEPVLTRLTSIANAAGLPALSVPTSRAGELPVAVQFMSTAECGNWLEPLATLVATPFHIEDPM